MNKKQYIYDQAFAEKWHPNYAHCDEVAWLDDYWCCQDNESDNLSHWAMYANEIAFESEDIDLCALIYESGGKVTDEILDYVENHTGSRDFSLHKYGRNLARKYAYEIQCGIDYYEDKIMSEAIENYNSSNQQ